MFVVDFYKFEGYGFLWILISIPLALIGLFLNLIYLAENCKNDLKKAIIGVAIIQVNIPIAIWVLNKQADIEKRAYLQINYDGIDDLSSVKLGSDYFEKEIGELESQDSKIVYFYPEYVDGNSGDSYPDVKPIRLYLITEGLNHKIELILPRIDKGDCEKIYIDKDFKLLDRWN